MPDLDELVDRIVELCYVNEQGMLICKSDVKFNYSNNRRQIALRDYMI